MSSRALIVTVPFTGTPQVPDLQLASPVWEIVTQDYSYVINIDMECLALSKIGIDGSKTAFAGAGTSGIMAKLSHLGTDAQLLTAYYANPTLNAKALGWGVAENATTDGFLALFVLAGQHPYSSGLDYPP